MPTKSPPKISVRCYGSSLNLVGEEGSRIPGVKRQFLTIKTYAKGPLAKPLNTFDGRVSYDYDWSLNK